MRQEPKPTKARAYPRYGRLRVALLVWYEKKKALATNNIIARDNRHTSVLNFKFFALLS